MLQAKQDATKDVCEDIPVGTKRPACQLGQDIKRFQHTYLNNMPLAL